MPPIYAQCLGTFAVKPTAASDSDLHFATDRVRALLAYLLNQPDQPQQRDYLAYLIWPDRPDRLARQNLRKTLSRLRQATKPHQIVATDYQTVRLNTAVIHSDLATFQQYLQADPPTLDDKVAAAALYQGEFLRGFHFDDSPPFTEWLLLAREAWQRQARQLFADLVADYTAVANLPQTITYARRYLAIEPWDEAMQRVLLTALAQSDQRAAAMTHYQAYVTDLQTELGLPPEAETVQLMQQLQQEADKATAPAPVWHGFPLEQTTFLGREAELERLHTLLTDSSPSLITIIGAGGMGKTRLACQAAQTLPAATFPDGIYFINCTTINDPADFLPHLINQLGIELDGSRPSDEQLHQFLAHQPRLLLLLDNFEQLSYQAADLLTPLRQQGASLLITSRHALNLQGEQRISLRGLLQETKGAALFMARAGRYGYTDFAPAERQMIDQLVHLVAGMPLAIEMAAAWLRAYPLPTLLQFLQENMRLWVAPQADVPDRHQSLTAVFDGSWQLLSPSLQPILARLSCLQATFTAEAAREVAQATFFDLAQLVDRSLLLVGRDGRYYSHPLLRQLAQEKLASMGAEAAQTAERHGRYYLTLLQHIGEPLRGARSKTAVQQIQQEYDNIRAAWQWAQQWAHTTHQTGWLTAAAPPLADYFLLTGLFAEGAALLADVDPLASAELLLERKELTAVIQRITPLLSQPELDTPSRLRAYTLLSAAYHQQGQIEQMGAMIQAGLPLAAQQPQAIETAYFYIQATFYHIRRGDHEQARQQAEPAHAILLAANDLWGASQALYASAAVDGVTNQLARPKFLQIWRWQKQLGSASLQRLALKNLALGSMLQGDYVTAVALCQEELALCQRLNHDQLIAQNRLLWGRLHYRLGNWDEAATAYEQALATWEAEAARLPAAQALVYMALLANAQGDPQRASALCTQASHWSQPLESKLATGKIAWCRARLLISLGEWEEVQQCGETAVSLFEQLQMPGRLMDARAIVAYALWQQGESEAALAQVDEIMAYRAKVGWLKSDDPFYLEWCCYQVWHGTGDDRAAPLWAETNRQLRAQLAALQQAEIAHGMGQVARYRLFLGTYAVL